MNDKESCIELLTQVIEKIDNLPSGPPRIRDLKEGKYQFPICLSVGDGEQINITPEIDQMRSRFSKSLLTVFFQPQQSEFTHSEWNSLVKREFGICLQKHLVNERVQLEA